MIYYDKYDEGCRVAVWHVTETLDELTPVLPDDESVRNEAQERFRAEGRQLEWTAVRVLLFTMLGRQVPIHYDEDGAPHLPDYERLDISISHTRGYVAVMLSEQGVVGIDVEQISDRVERIKKRFVNDDERAETVVQLLLHWSAKETAFKLLHENKVDFLKHLHITPFEMDERQEGTFTLRETRTDDEQTLCIHYKVFPDFVLTYAHVPCE